MEKIFHFRIHLQIIRILLSSFLLFFFLLPDLGLASESLEEAAKREGRVLFYSGMSTGDNQILLSGFQKKHPLVARYSKIESIS